MATEHHISIEKSARYFVHGNIENGKHLLIALHGYGHLSQFFINKFTSIDSSKFVVVCPEGLHRFYLQSNGGRVGASWMTKVDRQIDILDYINYLDKLLDQLKNNVKFDSITLLGFSQGGATASRWVAYGTHKFDRLILWATFFPPDIEKEYCKKFNKSSNYFVFGTNDEYHSNESIQRHFNHLSQLSIPFEMRTFDGNHNIHDKTLLNILNE